MFLRYLEPFKENDTFKIIYEGKEIPLTDTQLRSAYLFNKYLIHRETVRTELHEGLLNPEDLIKEKEADFKAKDEKLFEKVTSDPVLLEELTEEMEKNIYKYNSSDDNYFEYPDNYTDMQDMVIEAVYKFNK